MLLSSPVVVDVAAASVPSLDGRNRAIVIAESLASRAAKRGGFKRGFPDLDLSFLFCLFLSFLGLSRFFRDFPDLLGDGPGIFPIRPFSLSRPIKSTYEEQSRKGPRHNLDLSPKKWETPGLETPRLSFSQ